MLVDVVNESSGGLLSSLNGLLFFSAQRSGESSLVLKSEFSLGSVVFVGLLVHSSDDVGVWVKGFHSSLVSQWVLLLDGVEWSVVSSVSDNALDGIGVDDLSDISVGQDGSVEMISTLFLSSESVRSEDLVEGLEGRFSPDDESSEVTTWGELSQVESVDIADFNAWDVSDGLEEGSVFVVVDEEWALSESVSSVSELTLSWSDGLGVDDSFNIIISTESLEERDDFLGLGNTFELIIDDQWEVWNVVDSVTSGKDEWSDSRSSQSRSDGVSLLLDVDLSVPSSPGLQWSEHSTFSAGVGESTLSSSAGTRSTDSWNSGNSSTWTPGFS